MAAQGKIPGAAKLGSRWTFNESKLRQWISDKEEETRRIIETRRQANFDVRGAWSENARYEKLYEELMSPKPRGKGTRRR